MHWVTDLFPFIPQRVLVLAFAFLLIWFLFKWGDYLFFTVAQWAFWHQQLTETIWYFLIAMWMARSKPASG